MRLTLATVADGPEIAEVKVVGWRTTYAAWVPESVLARFLGVVRTRRLYERLGARYVATRPAGWAPEVVREAWYRWDDLAALKVGPTAAG